MSETAEQGIWYGGRLLLGAADMLRYALQSETVEEAAFARAVAAVERYEQAWYETVPGTLQTEATNAATREVRETCLALGLRLWEVQQHVMAPARDRVRLRWTEGWPR